MGYEVDVAIDALDPNPEVMKFDDFYEAIDFIYEDIQRRVDFHVDHSTQPISDQELDSLRELEAQLYRVREIDE
jgi:hypothetical protein